MASVENDGREELLRGIKNMYVDSLAWVRLNGVRVRV